MIKKINIEENLYSTRLTLLRNQEKINEIIDCFDILKKLEQELYHNHNKKIDNILDDIDSLGERIEELEGKAILKPDYEPEDSALNCVAKKGTFEWALIQMKNIKAVRRSCWIKMRWWSFVTFPNEERNHICEIHLFSLPEKILHISLDDIFALDWEIVGEN